MRMSTHFSLKKKFLFLFVAIGLMIAASLSSGSPIKFIISKFNKMPRSLQVIFEKKPAAFSFHPLNVDMIENNAIVQNVVSTLLRQDRSHRRTPYLARSWEQLDQGKSWAFTLRKGLVCDDGTPISAANYKRSLERIFQLRLPKTESIPTLEKLYGWADFRNGKTRSIDGIQAKSDDLLVLNFESPVQEELLAFLSLAHFGFFCESDFTPNGEWKDDQSIVSSGPYRIRQNNKDGNLTLEKRSSWPLNHEDTYSVVEFHQDLDFKAKIESDKDLFVIVNGVEEPAVPTGFSVFSGALNRLTALVLSQNPESSINRLGLQEVLPHRLMQRNLQAPVKSLRFSPAKGFFAEASWDLEAQDDFKTQKLATEPIHLTLGVRPQAPQLLINQCVFLIENTLLDLGIKTKIEVVQVAANDIEKNAKFMSNKTYDFRLATVVTGTSYADWMAKMMFTGNLGIQFPDPKQQVARLADFEKGSDSAFQFEKIVQSQNALVPLYHSGATWLHSEKVDLDAVSPFTSFPNLDLVRTKL